MHALSYYDTKCTRRRLLGEGDIVRNTHNYIKAILIEEHIPMYARVLDLGCDQGGDLLKIRRRAPSAYRGIDMSRTALKALAHRVARSDFPCRVELQCLDFSAASWSAEMEVDAISCQFAIQHAFATRERAKHTFHMVGRALNPGCVFFGTLPMHDAPSYCPVVVTLPDDARECVEFSARREEVVGLCVQNGLTLEMWRTFSDYYAEKSRERPALARAMRATVPPHPANVVFVFRKHKLSQA